MAVNSSEDVNCNYRHLYEQNVHVFTYSFNDANQKKIFISLILFFVSLH